MDAHTNKNDALAQTVGQSVPKDEVKASYPDSTMRAIQNTLKLMDGQYGGGFFIKFIMDVGTCYGWLNLIIVYPDGCCKSIVMFKNCMRETDTESSNGVYQNPNKPRKNTYKLFNVWDGPDMLNNYDSLTEYETPTMTIPETVIWKKIVENYSKIPIVKINQTSSLEQLLEELCSCAAERAKEYGQGFMDEPDRCYISTEDFREVVEANGWNVSQARTQLDLQGLFDKDTGTRGYQKSKRIGNEVKRFYAIKKRPSSGEGVLPKSLRDTKYDPGYLTKSEKERKQLQREVRELTDKYNDLLQKHEPTAEPLA